MVLTGIWNTHSPGPAKAWSDTSAWRTGVSLAPVMLTASTLVALAPEGSATRRVKLSTPVSPTSRALMATVLLGR